MEIHQLSAFNGGQKHTMAMRKRWDGETTVIP
jgi:hypothetical protein